MRSRHPTAPLVFLPNQSVEQRPAVAPWHDVNISPVDCRMQQLGLGRVVEPLDNLRQLPLLVALVWCCKDIAFHGHCFPWHWFLPALQLPDHVVWELIQLLNEGT